MSNDFNEMFKADESFETTTNARSLAGTAQLTTLATSIASEILKTIDARFDEYKEMIAASKVEHKSMDNLITAVYPLDNVDVEFLKQLDEGTLEGMLKSQQSKRSRTKGKTMTMDNYRAMLTAAISENLIRLATGKQKSASSHRVAGSVEYTAEQLEQLANDQEKLRKEIRNVQSKKSIMKSKENFDETSEQWLALLAAEESLKNLRADVKTVTVDVTKDKLAELLAQAKDINSMKPAEAKKLLEEIKQLTETKAEDASVDAPAAE